MTTMTYLSARSKKVVAATAIMVGLLPFAASAATVPITGWAWSSADDTTSGTSMPFMGWISMGTQPGETVTYGVYEDTTSGALSGYAWSSNLGWISFNETTGCPSGSCAPKVDLSTQTLSGWARACAAFTDAGACVGTADSGSGGWDGWIALSNATQNPDCSWSGHGWGSTNVGWISFGPFTFGGNNYGAKAPAGNAVCLPPAADLQGGYINEISAVAGTAKDFTSTITNIGTAPAVSSIGSIYNRLQRTNGPLDADGVTTSAITDISGDVAVASPIAPSASQTGPVFTKSYTFPLTDVNTVRYLRVCADSADSVAETNGSGTGETNNCGAWKPIQVANVLGPDLTIDHVNQSIVPVSFPVYFGTTIRNIGTGPTTQSSFWNLLQRADSYNSSTGVATNVVDLRSPVSSASPKAYVGIIPAGGTGPLTYSVYAFPATDAGATRYIRACADKSTAGAAGAETEIDETNNCSAWWAVVVTYVNLQAGPVTPAAGSTAVATTFSATITNQGTGSTGVGFTNLFQKTASIDVNGNATATVYDMGTANVGALDPTHSSEPASVAYTFPAGDVGTTQYVRACADKSSAGSAGSVNEVNTTSTAEQDNCGAWTPVAVGAAQSPTGSISAGDCAIPVGSSSCSTTITWSSSNTTDAGSSVTRDYDNNSAFDTGHASGSQSATFPYAATAFSLSLNFNGTRLSQVSVQPHCASGSHWDSATNKCVTDVVTPPTPSMSCTNNVPVPAPVGTTVTFTAVASGGASAPYVFRDSLGNTLQSGSQLTLTKQYNTNGTFAVTVEASNAPAVGCGAAFDIGTGGGGAKPEISISAYPERLPKCTDTTLTWTSTGSATSCTILRDEATTSPKTIWTLGGNTTYQGGAAGNVIDRVCKQTVYTASCTNANGTGPTKTVTVNVNGDPGEF